MCGYGMYIWRVLAAFMLFVSLLFWGCATLPTEQDLVNKTHTPRVFTNAPILQTIATTTKQPAEYKDFQETFYSLFEDKDLHYLAQTALTHNTNIRTLESNIKQARANAKITTWNLFPKANAGLNYNYSDNNYKQIQTSVTQNTTNASLSFSWEIDVFGKLNALRLASKQQILQTISNLQSAQVILLGDVANYYFTMRQIEQSLHIQRQIARNLQSIYTLTEQKYRLGLVGLDSLATTKGNYLTQKNAILNLEYTLEQNKNALLVLLNTNELGFEPNSAYTFQTPNIPQLDIMPTNVLFNRPDVRAGVFALNATIYQRYNKKMALLPSLSLSGNLGQILFSPQLGIGDMVWQMAGSLAMPLLNRQTLTQDYIIAKENTKQAFYALQNTLNTALAEIENAAKYVATTQEILQYTKENYDMQKNTFEIMETRHKRQLIDSISQLEYENIYLQAQITLCNANLNEQQAAIALYKALGGNFHPNELKEGILQSMEVPKEDAGRADTANDI